MSADRVRVSPGAQVQVIAVSSGRVTRASCRQVAATYARQEDGSEPEWNYEPLLQHLKYSAIDLQTLARIEALCRTLGLPVTNLQRDALQAALGELTSPGQPVATKEKR